ncbi:MAG: SHOCT domain-containing protein [Dehalogenimonas sp.]
MMYGDAWGLGMWAMMSFMVLFWVGVAALVVWLIVRATRGVPYAGERRTPLDIARERYAKGEISKEAFEDIKKNLI